jgi:hypothetical protein
MDASQSKGHGWAELSELLRRGLGRGPLTWEEALATFDALPDERLSDAEIAAIFQSAGHPPPVGRPIQSPRPARKGHAGKNGKNGKPRRLVHEPLENRDVPAPLFPLFSFADPWPAEAYSPPEEGLWHTDTCYVASAGFVV